MPAPADEAPGLVFDRDEVRPGTGTPRRRDSVEWSPPSDHEPGPCPIASVRFARPRHRRVRPELERLVGWNRRHQL